MREKYIAVIISTLVPFAGAMGYIHGTFASKEYVKKVERVQEKSIDKLKRLSLDNSEKINAMYNILCKMAIKQRLDDAIEVCTNK